MTTKMILALVLIIGLAACDQIPYRGLMVALTKPGFAKDILYILRTILQDAFLAAYPNVEEDETAMGIFTFGKYIKDIKVTKMTYTPETLWHKVNYDSQSHKVSMSTTESVVKYAVSFGWKISLLGFSVAFGEGNATLSAKDFLVSMTLPDKEMVANVSAVFDVELGEIKGQGVSEEIKAWMKNRLRVNTSIEIGKTIERNKQLLTQYIFRTYLSADRQIENGHVITYKNTPTNASEFGDNLWISFATELLLDNKTLTVVNNDRYIDDATGLTDAAVYLSPDLVLASAEVRRIMGVYDGKYNLTEFGYTGTVTDFLPAMPELGFRYESGKKVDMYCRLGGIESEESSIGAQLTQECNFTVGSTEPFLRAWAVYRVPFYHGKTADAQQLFVAKLGQPELIALGTHPQNPDISILTTQLFNAAGMKLYKDKTVDMPRLRFEPLREFRNFTVSPRTKYYAAFYDMASD